MNEEGTTFSWWIPIEEDILKLERSITAREAKDERNIEIAKNMLNEGSDIEFISKVTNISKEEIESLVKETK